MKRKKCFWAICIILQAIIVLVVVTYSWIEGTVAPSVTADNIELAAAQGLYISMNNELNSTVSLNKYLNDNAADDFYLSETSSASGATDKFYVRDYAAEAEVPDLLNGGVCVTEATANEDYAEMSFKLVSEQEGDNRAIFFDPEKSSLGGVSGAIRVAISYVDLSGKEVVYIFGNQEEDGITYITDVSTLAVTGMGASNIAETGLQTVHLFSDYGDAAHPLFTTYYDAPIEVTMRIWMEGGDVDCTDEICSGQSMNMTLFFDSASVTH